MIAVNRRWRRWPSLLVCLAASALVAGGFRTVAGGMYNFKTSSVVQLNSDNFRSMVLDSKETWAVEFYADWCGHCQQLAPKWERLASRLDGVARVGAVDADAAADLVSRYSVDGYPTILVFAGRVVGDARPSVEFSGDRSVTALADYVKAHLPTYVAVVRPSGVDAFFDDARRLPHVLLFSPKNTTSPLYKGLSATYAGRVSLGELRTANEPDAATALARFRLTGPDAKHPKLPALLAFPPASSAPGEAVRHEGKLDAPSLRAFLDRVVATMGQSAAGTAGGAGGGGGGGGAKAPTFEQPIIADTGVAVLSSRADYDAHCGAREDGRLCALSLGVGLASEAGRAAVEALAERFRFDNLAFAVADTGVSTGAAALAAVLGVGGGDGGGDGTSATPPVGFVVVRPKKGRVAVMEGGDVGSFLDRVVGGDARYKRLTEELPVWADEAAPKADDAADAKDDL